MIRGALVEVRYLFSFCRIGDFLTAPLCRQSSFFPTLFLSQWFKWAHSLLTQFLVFWLHNYRIIASLYLTQQGVLNHWNHEITDWDGMICCSQHYFWLLPSLWWENRQEGGERGGDCLQGEAVARSTSPQPVLVSTQRRSQRPQPIFDALWPWTQGKAARLRK